MTIGDTSGDPFRVLMIDDDERVLALARLMLAKDGAVVETATNAAESSAWRSTAERKSA